MKNVIKNVNEIFFALFFSKSSVYFALPAQLNSGIKHSSEILDSYLDLIKFTIENVDLHIQVVPNILKIFLVSELSISFQI